MSRRGDVEEFYTIIDELRDRVGGCRRLCDCTGKSGWPQRGLYFFFEGGELRDDGVTQRIVRVGTHAVSANSKAKLWTRLRTHRGNRNGGGNHRGSIFRLRVGEALLKNAEYPDHIHKSWGDGSSAPKATTLGEASLELAVSDYIGKMPFLWIAVDDEPSSDSMRAYLERNSIGLLSNYKKPSLDAPSQDWLGRSSAEPTIRESGLWNTDHVDCEYTPSFLSTLRSFVDAHR